MGSDNNLNSLARTLASEFDFTHHAFFPGDGGRGVRCGKCGEAEKYYTHKPIADRLEAVIREAIEKTIKETRTEVIKTIMSGRTINNFGHVTPIRRVQAYDCTCTQCGHNWLAREIPARCAKCKRRSWNLKKGEKVQIGRPKKKV